MREEWREERRKLSCHKRAPLVFDACSSGQGRAPENLVTIKCQILQRHLFLQGRESYEHLPKNCSNEVCRFKVPCQRCCLKRYIISRIQNYSVCNTYLSAWQSPRPWSTLSTWQRNPKNCLERGEHLKSAEFRNLNPGQPEMGWTRSWQSWWFDFS